MEDLGSKAFEGQITDIRVWGIKNDEEAFNAGRLARYNGLGLEDNPFTHPSQMVSYDKYVRGWIIEDWVQNRKPARRVIRWVSKLFRLLFQWIGRGK